MPGSDDKPFKCSTDGCGQTFTNEDHLTVHKLKHQMSLTLSPGGNKFLFPDQTPTPTKFLKYGEEVGLFTDIKNPFDDAFKTASEYNMKSGKVGTPLLESMTLPHTSENDTLNTPTPHIPVIQNDTPIKKRYRFADNVPSQLAATTPPEVQTQGPPIPGPDPSPLGPIPGALDPTPGDTQREGSVSSVSASKYGSSGPASQESQDTVVLEVDEPDVLEFSGLSKPPLLSPQSTKPSPGGATTLQQRQLLPSPSQKLPTDRQTEGRQMAESRPQPIAPKRPHTLAFGSNQTVQSGAGFAESSTHISSSAGNVTIVPSPVQSLQSASITSTGASQYMIQMMIQTSDGKYVPVNIPALPANNPSPSKPESSQPPAQPVAPVVQVIQPTVQPAVANRNLPIVMGTANKMTGNHSNTGPGNVNASLLTKQRLKAAIQQNSPMSQKTFSVLSPVANSRTPSTSDSNPPTPLSGRSVHSTVEYKDADSSVMTMRDEEESIADDDENDKRKKFLERNRAAAHRCRAKKREWVKNLEKKAEDLQATNTRLQNEVTQLRAEMAQLKALLLAHKDCPITIQQRNSGQLTLQRVSETSDMNVVVPSSRTTIVSPQEPKPKIAGLVAIKPTNSQASSAQGLSQLAKVPAAAYRLHNDPNSKTSTTVIAQPVTQIGQQIGHQIGQQIGQQLIAVDLSQLSNLPNVVQLHSVSKS